jgi:hypothetical protein
VDTKNEPVENSKKLFENEETRTVLKRSSHGLRTSVKLDYVQGDALRGVDMDQITSVKTPNSKCRLYWRFIDWIQSVMLVFSTPLVN